MNAAKGKNIFEAESRLRQRKESKAGKRSFWNKKPKTQIKNQKEEKVNGTGQDKTSKIRTGRNWNSLSEELSSTTN
ncbi:MAG: hypothetical protein STSR0004_19850 [Peptococcaceae bacterium]